MKYLLITGSKDSGKSTTIQELCRQLNPKEVFRLNISNNSEEKSELIQSQVELIFNNVFILKINDGLSVLVVAGCPTEIDIKIEKIMEICKSLGLNISIAIVAKRLFERKLGFNTPDELSSVGTFIHEELINRINDIPFSESESWKKRILRLKSIVLKNI